MFILQLNYCICQKFAFQDITTHFAVMPRLYKRILGSRNYVTYSNDTLEECVTAVTSGRLSKRAAALKYNIPISTLKNKLKGKYSNKPIKERRLCYRDIRRRTVSRNGQRFEEIWS